jgi:hypothetical protein
MAEGKATRLYRESWLVPGETPGTQAIRLPNGKFVSVQENGDIEHDRDTAGSWESGKKVGNELIISAHEYPHSLPIALGT